LTVSIQSFTVQLEELVQSELVQLEELL
jgi:hypothetical protein